MYRQTYEKFYSTGGIQETCVYSKLREVSGELSEKETKKVQKYLKSLDSYGYKKIEAEEMFTKLSS